MKLPHLLLLTSALIALLVAGCGSAHRPELTPQADEVDAYSGATTKPEQGEAQSAAEPAGDAGVPAAPPSESTE